MFKLTKTIEYGLIALAHLQSNPNDLISAREIAQKYLIPYDILAKILQKMSHCNYISSTKGVNGGYKINLSKNEINLTQFIEKMEGPISIVNCIMEYDCEQIENCNIKNPINKINNSIRQLLDQVYLNEIIN